MFYVILTSPPFPVSHYQKRQIASSVIREMLVFQSHTASLSQLDIMEISLKIQKVQDTRADLIKMIKAKMYISGYPVIAAKGNTQVFA